MLDCRNSRIDYGELLIPPSGYRFDRAVATTYSADLVTMLSVPVALVYAQTLEGDLGGVRLQLIEAVKKFTRQVKIYHQAGQIHVPSALNWLYAYLEEAMVPILPENAFTVFHPKVWVVRYTPDEDHQSTGSKGRVIYRVLVLSRNLTFDRSWDVAACLEGKVMSEAVEGNTPLVDFVAHLHEKESLPDFENLAAELQQVRFDAPEPFESHSFHPSGIPGYLANVVANEKAPHVLAMSPFLHQDALRVLRENTSESLHLFSEPTALSRLPTGVLEGIDAYQLNELIVDGEWLEGADEGGDDTRTQSLHAKLFVFERGDRTAWVLGSANATAAASKGNVEFMLKMETTTSAGGIAPLRKELAGDEDEIGIFVPFDSDLVDHSDLAEIEQERAFRLFEHAILRAEIRGAVHPAANGRNWDLCLAADLSNISASHGFEATIQPFNTTSKTAAQTLDSGTVGEHRFPNIPEVELSRFVQLHLRDPAGELSHRFLLRIELEGLPEDRLDNILRKLINSEDKFFEYLRFLLSDEITKEDLLKERKPTESNAEGDAGGWVGSLPIYEHLLLAASRRPRTLAEIDEVISQLVTDTDDEPVVSDAFLSFWGAFRTRIPSPTRKGGS